MKRLPFVSIAVFAVSVIAATTLSCSAAKDGIVASGTIEATEVRISSKSQGELLALRAAEGETVAKGQTLAEIDHEALDLQLGQAVAGVDYADAQLRLLLEGAREEDIAQASEVLAQASEALKLAEADDARTKELLLTGSTTRKQADDAAARYAVAKAQYAQAEQALKKLSNLARPEELVAARAKLEQARYSRLILEKSIRDCTVASPLSGTVSLKLAEAGELVGVGTGLYVIADLSLVHLTIYVSEADLGRVSIGREADVRVDSFPDRPFVGKVASIAQEAEFTPKNVQTKDERIKLVFGVKIDIPNPDSVLKPGMSADATLRTDATHLTTATGRAGAGQATK